MRVLVCGSRHFNDYLKLRDVLDDVFLDSGGYRKYKEEVIIEGEARGADTLARQYAEKEGVGLIKFPANWNTYGKAAGPIRNKQMLDEGKPDKVIAFLAKGSRGTKNMIEQAKKANIPVEIINI